MIFNKVKIDSFDKSACWSNNRNYSVVRFDFYSSEKYTVSILEGMFDFSWVSYSWVLNSEVSKKNR